jgi:CHASE3 domain sensor protein
MSLRTRLIIFVLLFGSAVLTIIFALVYLARSISNSLAAIENIRQRQLVAVQMNAHLRDAEAALYRYQINGEAGFKSQFVEQLNNFSSDLEQYGSFAVSPIEQQWASALERAYSQTLTAGNNLIELRDNQTSRLGDFLAK